MKYRGQMTRIVSKLAVFFIRTNNDMLAVAILMFALNEFRQQREALQVYMNSLFAVQDVLM